MPYREVEDICAYLKIADSSVDAKAALVMSIGENAFLIWFRYTPDSSGNHTATHCDTLQHTATHCNSQQLTGYCNIL